jgi:hypothetical protein
MDSGFRRRVTAVLVVAAFVLSMPAPAWAAVATVPQSLTLTPGNAQVVLSWAAPSSNGGSNITDYMVESSTNSGASWSTFIHTASTSTTSTVTSLTNNTTYWFRVSAVNGDGTGPAVTAVATPVSAFTAQNPAKFLACPSGTAAAAGFTDTTSTDVDCIAMYGITKGTTATTYSPIDSVNRWQMALFLTRMANRAGATLPTGTDQGFTDIGGYSAEIQTAINQIKQLGITVGKTATTYDPVSNVTREEMALFLVRLLKTAKIGPGGHSEFVSGTSGSKEIKSNDTDHNFTDLNQSYLYETQAAVINLFNLGVTDSQAATSYDPLVNMSRAAMATFMTRALAHTNARPAGFGFQASTYTTSGTPTVYFSVTNRSADFAPIVGTPVDTFKFVHSTDTTVVAFTSAGICSSAAATSVGNTRCSVDASDPITDSDGNLALFSEIMPVVNIVDYWAWTATPTTPYDNDVYASIAKKISVQTTG